MRNLRKTQKIEMSIMKLDNYTKVGRNNNQGNLKFKKLYVEFKMTKVVIMFLIKLKMKIVKKKLMMMMKMMKMKMMKMKLMKMMKKKWKMKIILKK